LYAKNIISYIVDKNVGFNKTIKTHVTVIHVTVFKSNFGEIMRVIIRATGFSEFSC